MNHQNNESTSLSRVDPSEDQPRRVRIGPRINKGKKAEIRLQKNGTTVEAIKVICACGEQITIQCNYTETE